MYLNKTTFINLLVTACLIVIFVIIVRPPENGNRVYIQTQTGDKVTFNVEVAKNKQQRNKGLMFRESLPKKNGMLFIFEKEAVVQMWMKDTFIPLDMIFIGSDGKIKHIAKNTTPKSIKTISSGISVIAVLEINAMLTDEFNINIDDVVLHPQITKKNKE